MNQAASKRISDLLQPKINRQFLYYLDICTRCGICKDACHVYASTKDASLMPPQRIRLLRKLYQQQTNPLTRLLSLQDKNPLDEEAVYDELYRMAYTCTGCRRCMVYCPFGIDISWITGIEKALLVALKKIPSELDMLANVALEKSQGLKGYHDSAAKQITTSLEPQLRRICGQQDATIPIGVAGARILYVSLAGIDSILLPALIFNQAGESWTLSQYEAYNYGFMAGDTPRAIKIADRIVQEAKDLGVEEVVITECGHGFRIMKHLFPVWTNQKLPFKVKSVFNTWNDYILDHRLAWNSARITDPVTYHDPCQMGRNGGIFEEPRNILKKIVPDFREMTPNREENWCCGGGGGLIAQRNLTDYREKTGLMKVKQIQATGAKIVATPCGICRQQLTFLNQRYNLGIRVASVAELLVRAMFPADALSDFYPERASL